MRNANVVGVDDQELGVAGETEPFGERLASVLRVRVEKSTRKTEEKQNCDAASDHWPIL